MKLKNYRVEKCDGKTDGETEPERSKTSRNEKKNIRDGDVEAILLASESIKFDTVTRPANK